MHGHLFFIGHFDADRALAGDRRLDADIFGSQCHLDVILQVADAAHPHAKIRTHLKTRDARSDMRADQRGFYAELIEDIDQLLALDLGSLHIGIRLAFLSCRRIIEQRKAGQTVTAVINVKLTDERFFGRLLFCFIRNDAQFFLRLLFWVHDIQMIIFLICGKQHRLLCLDRSVIRIYEERWLFRRSLIDVDIRHALWLFFLLLRLPLWLGLTTRLPS